MTDLTTMHLKCLLAQATPGPWEARDSDCITSEHGEVLWNADQAVDWNRNDHDVNLAAHAPQLAQEVLRMRKELIGWANDEARAHNALVTRAQEAGGAGIITTHKTIYNRIWEILGEVNE